MKKIAVGDLGEFWYGDYKEPFVQLEGAVPGYPQGVILKDDDGKLLCAFCGKTYDNLGNHAVRKHGLHAREYKQEVGLLQGSALLSERGRQAVVAQGLRLGRRRGQKEHMRRIGKLVRPYQQRSNLNPTERQNKTGRCYAQVLAVARNIAAKGHRVSQKRLAAVGINQNVVERMFGNYDELNRLVGGAYSANVPHRLPNDVLLSGLRQLAIRLQRTPARSDLRRYGLSSAATYSSRFGTYTRACELAGLTPYWLPPSPHEHVAILNVYAMTGRISDVVKSTGRGQETVVAVLSRYGIATLPPHFVTERRRMKELAGEIARRIAGEQEAVAA